MVVVVLDWCLVSWNQDETFQKTFLRNKWSGLNDIFLLFVFSAGPTLNQGPCCSWWWLFSWLPLWWAWGRKMILCLRGFCLKNVVCCNSSHWKHMVYYSLWVAGISDQESYILDLLNICFITVCQKQIFLFLSELLLFAPELYLPDVWKLFYNWL